MAQETGAHIADLNPLWPAEADDVSGGADQIRKLKVALQNDFPNIDAEVSCSPTELNRSYNVTAGTVAASKVVTADSSKDINFASGNATNFKHVTGSIGTAVTAVTQSAGTGATPTTLVATVAYADNSSGAVNVQLKSVSSNVTHTPSDTSFEDVTGLTFSNVAEGRYAFEAFLDCEIPATPDIKITFDVTAITGSFFGTATAQKTQMQGPFQALPNLQGYLILQLASVSRASFIHLILPMKLPCNSRRRLLMRLI